MDTEKNIPAEEAEELVTPQPAEDLAEEEILPAEPSEEETTEEPAEEPEETAEESPAVPAKPKWKIRGALIYCSIVFAFALCILILLCCAMNPLRSYLTQYEDSQPKYVRDAVYEMLFADPDWELLYDLAGVDSTVYERKEAFSAYMEAKTDGQELDCRETSAGLSGQHRYLLSCNGEDLAAFTIAKEGEKGGFDVWNLAGVEVFFSRDETITIVKPPEYTSYVNGVSLDDSFTTVTVQTVAEDFLPEGIHGYRWVQQQVSGFLVQPEVIILDENNNPVPVYYSQETDTYSTDIPTSPEITDEEYDMIVAAAEADALFAIREIKITKLRQHFDPDSEIYAAMCDADPFVKTHKSYKIDEDSISVTDFYRYSDDLFSARVTLKMDVTVKSKNVKTYEIDTTYFFTRSNGEKYLVTSGTDKALQQQITQVLLTWEHHGEILRSEMTAVSASITAPEAFNEDGTAAAAWGKQEADGTLTPVLTLLEDGTFGLVEGQTLEPMTLYPIFADAEPEE